MKKQIKKLSLNKKTISNLSTSEMAKNMGGVAPTNGHTCAFTCNTCYTCLFTCRKTCSV